ncbi:MAG: ELWxxDGT repeat protein [Thermoanaerobaculia bacterium]
MKDLDPDPPVASLLTTTPREFVTFQGEIFFQGCDALGCELWKTDGTPAGTVQVADIAAGAASSSPASFTVVGSTLFFFAGRSAEGSELWKSDGTGPGTVLIKDIRPGSSGSSPALPTVVGSTLFFRANDGTSGTELWKSDGTPGGTVMVADINAGASSSTPQALTAFGSLLLFVASSSGAGPEPWVTDGSSGGTVALGDLRPGVQGSICYPASCVSGRPFAATLGGLAYFAADDGAGLALWKTDGTPPGTTQVRDFDIGGPFTLPYAVASVAGKVLFGLQSAATLSSVSTASLWQSDGTSVGTAPLASFETDPMRKGVLFSFATYAGTLYFTGCDREHGCELWKSDGTVLGTSRVKDIWPGPGSSAPRIFPTAIGLLIAASDPENGSEAWFSDGSEGGTVLLRDAFPGRANGAAVLSSSGVAPASLGGLVYFSESTANGSALWSTDGSAAGTTEAVILSSLQGNGRPWELSQFGSRVLFSAHDSASGREPWISDGSSGGTLQLADLESGAASSDPQYFASLGGLAVFRAWTASTGWELWKTDGTPAGTGIVTDLVPGAGSSNPAGIVALGPVALFRACDPTAGCELWKTDGSAAGTQRVLDILPGVDGSFPEELTPAGGKIFFRATTPALGCELWASDGTPGGTVAVLDIDPGAASSFPQDLKGTAARLFFAADDGTHGLEVWTSDGTPGGTILTKDVAPGAPDSLYAATADYTAIHQGQLFFRAVDDGYVTTDDLWRSDGTPAGTVKVREMDDFMPGGTGQVAWLGSGGSFLWFGLYDFSNGNWEPYRTDGTSSGTIFVQELRPGSAGSQPYGWVGHDGMAFFSAIGPDGGRLWSGTGYPNETVALGPPGPTGIRPLVLPPYLPLVEAGLTLFFSATDSATGYELYAYGFPIFLTSFESDDFSPWDAVVGASP